jgi:hypothetical protein
MELLILELVVGLALFAATYLAALTIKSRAKRKRAEKPTQPPPSAAAGSRTQFGKRPRFKE